jgi:hypothetical protein
MTLECGGFTPAGMSTAGMSTRRGNGSRVTGVLVQLHSSVAVAHGWQAWQATAGERGRCTVSRMLHITTSYIGRPYRTLANSVCESIHMHTIASHRSMAGKLGTKFVGESTQTVSPVTWEPSSGTGAVAALIGVGEDADAGAVLLPAALRRISMACSRRTDRRW